MCQTRSDILNASQRELVHCLRVLVATRGAVKLDSEIRVTDKANPLVDDSLSRDQKLKGSSNAPTDRPSLIEEIPDLSEQTTQSDAIKDPEMNRPIDPALVEALDQLSDPLIPVRGHGLIVLSRLLESRDPCIRGHEERIFQAS
ncbi:unnamed protein product [Echinostoma caproni]|uniref:RTP1_C1 domain-containing protein n=1 Tax=Echinostoma caproni TaxID=27848 RepID=A0A183BBD5_9TREM|nr:unnamed protein product [Echinostoma caproni]